MVEVVTEYCVAGYDMQFDIKYAYFNFLQSINYPALHDMTHHGKKCMKSCSDPSAFNIRDGLDTDADVADGYMTDDCQECKDK